LEGVIVISTEKIEQNFYKNGGIMKTSELNEIGLNYRQIQRLIDQKLIEKIRHGYYILTNTFPKEEVIIARMFPGAIIYLESALLYYNYTNRIPNNWQITVNKHSNPKKYNIPNLNIKPYFIKDKYRKIGVKNFMMDNVKIPIYDRNKTICDIIRYEKKIDNEVFTNAIKNYIKDDKKNIKYLMEYGDKLNINDKIQKYIGMWL